MSRGLSAANAAETEKTHLLEVLLVHLAFDTPVFAHTAIGPIVFDGNTYTGVGEFGGTTAPVESENLGPNSIQLELDGIDAALIAEALDSGNYGDVVTIYDGYRMDDNTLVDDPWIAFRGKYEFSSLVQGKQNKIAVTVQHDLAILTESEGSKFSDEDQRQRHAADEGFEHIAENATVKLVWGAREVGSAGGSGTGGRRGPPLRRRN